MRQLSGRGLVDAALWCLGVIVADLWLFLLPARIFERKLRPGLREAYLALALNMALGVILTTPANPLSLFLQSSVGSGQSDGP